MRLRSFRFRIMLLSLLVSGVVILAAAAGFLRVIDQVSRERVDQQLRSLAEGRLRGRQPLEYWRNLGDSLRFVYGDQDVGRWVVQVRDRAGAVLYESPGWPLEEFLAPEPLPSPAMAPISSPPPRDGPPARPPRPGPRLSRRGGEVQAVPRLRMERPRFVTVRNEAGAWRIGVFGNAEIILAVGVDLGRLDAETARYRRAFLMTVGLALAALALGGWLLAGRALRPVTALTRTLEQITARDLSRRVERTREDQELARLIDVVNAMLERLETSFHQAVRFSADAAHELQTPLAVLQGELDHAVQTAAPASAEQQRYSGLLDEVQRLKGIIRKLLLLARADAGRLPLHAQEVDLSALAEEVADDTEAMAPEIRVERSIEPGVRIQADPDLLRPILQNLATNAVRYNLPADGRIRITLTARADTAELNVSNTGPALNAEDCERLFQRFYRGDASRRSSAEGAGLGLSLARELARAHQGDLRAEPFRDSMNTFVLTLPRPRPAVEHGRA